MPGTPSVGTTLPRPATGASGASGATQRGGGGGGNAAGGNSGAGGPSSHATASGERRSAGGRNGSATAPGPAGRRARRVARRERRLRSHVREFRGCLDSLAPLERKVLVLRAGVGDEHAHTRSRVARLLDVTVRKVQRVERSGLRRLYALGRHGGCGVASQAVEVAAGPVSAPTTTAPPQWAAPTSVLALPLDRMEVMSEHESSDDAPAQAPEAIVPLAGAALQAAGKGSDIDLTIVLLALLDLLLVAYATLSIRHLMRTE